MFFSATAGSGLFLLLLTALLIDEIDFAEPRSKPSNFKVPTQADPVVNRYTFSWNYTARCDSDLDILVWVHTAVGSFQKRQAIRNTWGNPRLLKNATSSSFPSGLKTRVVFFIGEMDPSLRKSKPTQEGVALEAEAYGDIVQASFLDSYRNLTYKAMTGLKWITERCSVDKMKLVLKSDDDMVVDLIPMMRHLEKLMHTDKGHWRTNTIFCDVWKNRYVFREPGKWMVTKQEFSEDVYPTYCPGLALLLTPDVIPKLWKRAERTPYFWVDDVFFTGLLTRGSDIQFYNFNALVHFGANPLVAMTLDGWPIYFRHTFPYRPRHFYGLWSWIEGQAQCSVVDETRRPIPKLS